MGGREGEVGLFVQVSGATNMSLFISLLFLVGIVGIALDSFWHGTKSADSVPLSLCYAFSLFGICVIIARESPAVRDSLLGTFAAFCLVMALRFVKQALEIKRKNLKNKGDDQKH